MTEQLTTSASAKFDWLNNTFTRYLVVGGLSTLTHFGVLILLVENLLLGVVLATGIAFTASLIVSFSLNYVYAFRSHTPVVDSFFKFVLVSLIGLCLNVLVMEISVNQLGMDYRLGYFVSIFFVTTSNFLLHYIWTFRKI